MKIKNTASQNNMARKKTKAEKVQSGYRLQNFKLQVGEMQAKKDIQEFAYLSKEYVRKDLTKTVLFSVLIIGLLVIAKRYLG